MLVDVEQVNNQIDQFTGTIAAVVVPITLITLVVGGIVVMNIMLVSVTERTFEVGLRKAVGATSKQILLQFLIESGLLCAFGGVMGLLVAWGVLPLITTLAGITMTITIGYILLAMICIERHWNDCGNLSGLQGCAARSDCGADRDLNA